MRRFDMPKSEYERVLDECGFTDSEKAVLALKRRGWANADVAEELYVSLRTVNRRVRSIKEKLDR